MGVRHAGCCRRGFRLSSMWGHETHECGVPDWVREPRAGVAAVACGGASCGAMTRLRGVLTCVRVHVRTLLLGARSSLWNHDSCEGCAELGAGAPCGRLRRVLRLASTWGHEASEGCAQYGRGCAMRTLPQGSSVKLHPRPRNA
eukprot:9244973-Pyramimonas_sp.AAC.2